MGMVGQIESIYGFPGSSVGKESACNTGDPGSIPGSGRSSGEGIGYPLQCSGTSLVAQLVKNRLQCRRPGFDPWVRKIPWRGKVYPFQYFGLENSMDCISPWGLKESHTTERLSLSCLEINFFLASLWFSNSNVHKNYLEDMLKQIPGAFPQRFWLLDWVKSMTRKLTDDSVAVGSLTTLIILY